MEIIIIIILFFGIRFLIARKDQKSQFSRKHTGSYNNSDKEKKKESTHNSKSKKRNSEQGPTKHCPICDEVNWSYISVCAECGHVFSENHNGDSQYETKIKNNSYEEDNEILIENLKKTITELRSKGKKAVALKDYWKERAKSFEKKLETMDQSNGNTSSKYSKIKNKFANMFHPDKIQGNNYEKIIKQEIFKEFWKEFEKLDKED